MIISFQKYNEICDIVSELYNWYGLSEVNNIVEEANKLKSLEAKLSFIKSKYHPCISPRSDKA